MSSSESDVPCGSGNPYGFNPVSSPSGRSTSPSPTSPSTTTRTSAKKAASLSPGEGTSSGIRRQGGSKKSVKKQKLIRTGEYTTADVLSSFVATFLLEGQQEAEPYLRRVGLPNIHVHISLLQFLNEADNLIMANLKDRQKIVTASRWFRNRASMPPCNANSLDYFDHLLQITEEVPEWSSVLLVFLVAINVLRTSRCTQHDVLIVSWTLEFFAEYLHDWIACQGGWEALIGQSALPILGEKYQSQHDPKESPLMDEIIARTPKTPSPQQGGTYGCPPSAVKCFSSPEKSSESEGNRSNFLTVSSYKEKSGTTSTVISPVSLPTTSTKRSPSPRPVSSSPPSPLTTSTPAQPVPTPEVPRFVGARKSIDYSSFPSRSPMTPMPKVDLSSPKPISKQRGRDLLPGCGESPQPESPSFGQRRKMDAPIHSPNYSDPESNYATPINYMSVEKNVQSPEFLPILSSPEYQSPSVRSEMAPDASQTQDFDGGSTDSRYYRNNPPREPELTPIRYDRLMQYVTGPYNQPSVGSPSGGGRTPSPGGRSPSPRGRTPSPDRSHSPTSARALANKLQSQSSASPSRQTPAFDSGSADSRYHRNNPPREAEMTPIRYDRLLKYVTNPYNQPAVVSPPSESRSADARTCSSPSNKSPLGGWSSDSPPQDVFGSPPDVLSESERTPRSATKSSSPMRQHLRSASSSNYERSPRSDSSYRTATSPRSHGARSPYIPTSTTPTMRSPSPEFYSLPTPPISTRYLRIADAPFIRSPSSEVGSPRSPTPIIPCMVASTSPSTTIPLPEIPSPEPSEVASFSMRYHSRDPRIQSSPPAHAQSPPSWESEVFPMTSSSDESF